MYRWIKKLHIYTGLLSFTGFTVWGIIGIWASFVPPPQERIRPEPQVRMVDFQVDGSATDQETSDSMIVASGLPFIQPGRKANRNRDGRLQVRYLTPNGTRAMVLLEDENKIRVEAIPSPHGFWHEDTMINVWGLVLLLTSIALFLIGASGIYLWFMTHEERWIGSVLLIGGLAFAFTSMYLVRSQG